jgi:hypothetical protein
MATPRTEFVIFIWMKCDGKVTAGLEPTRAY